MTSPRVKDYFISCDPMRPDLNMGRLMRMNKPELKQVIEAQAEMWGVLMPDMCGTKKELIQIIVDMASDADK